MRARFGLGSIILVVCTVSIIVLDGCGGGGGSRPATSGLVVHGGTASSGMGSVQVYDAANATALAQAEDYSPASVAASDSIVFRLIEKGDSYRGSVGTAPIHQWDEPMGVNTIKQPYYLSACEVTQAQWEAIAVRAGLTGIDCTPWATINPPSAIGGATAIAANRPAFGLGYRYIRDTLAAYNATVVGYSLRLPTADEWEHACRGGSSSNTMYSWGDSEKVATIALYAVVNEVGSTSAQPVGTRRPNELGFYDMHGNVWEWVQSKAIADGNMLRGGSWYDNVNSARSANKQYLDDSLVYGLVGARLVLEVP
jgi:formylglycine-generating enzyme required for sulfatase activity